MLGEKTPHQNRKQENLFVNCLFLLIIYLQGNPYLTLFIVTMWSSAAHIQFENVCAIFISEISPRVINSHSTPLYRLDFEIKKQ